MLGLRVRVDFRLDVAVPSRAMTDWLDRLTDSVSKATEIERQEAERKKYIVHKAEVLTVRGPELWAQFVQSCKDVVTELNKRVALRFPEDRDKQIAWADQGPQSFSLRGEFPSFSMQATCDVERQCVSLGGERRFSGTIECRSATLYMDLDKDGNPCLRLGECQIDEKDASRYLLELCLSSTEPVIPSG